MVGLMDFKKFFAYRSAFLMIAFVCCNTAVAKDWDDPKAPFSVKNNFTDRSTIHWIAVDDVQKACEKESHNRGYGGFNIAVMACSFYKGDQCTVITKKTTNMHTLGHEVRHCFQADWHK